MSDLAHADDSILNDEIRARLDKLNTLSDLINSLERQFDEANCLFRETLKCSTNRLSSIAKSLGKKSIRQGRVYNEARVNVEQSQTDCQRACIQYEQANKNHQIAKQAIQEAELKLRCVSTSASNGVISKQGENAIDSINFDQLSLDNCGANEAHNVDHKQTSNDSKRHRTAQSSSISPTSAAHSDQDIKLSDPVENDPAQSSLDERLQTAPRSSCDEHEPYSEDETNDQMQQTMTPTQINGSSSKHDNDTQAFDASDTKIMKDTTRLSEDLNQAIVRLIKAEEERGLSERQHLDHANKLIVAQENLFRLEREYGASIRRSQMYFDEAKRFNAKLNSVKSDINRLSEEIIGAKQAYAKALSELEEFSETLHIKAHSLNGGSR